MLLEMRIKNFVLIEELSLKFDRGLNVLTGETGAGKSILIDALSGILGEKMTTDMIRTGFEKSALEGVFDITGLQQVRSILEESGIDCDDNTLVLKRELFSSGKGRCFANATPIPIGKLKEISDYLVDIHGQNEHQNIARIAKHREILDGFADHPALLVRIQALYQKLFELKEALGSQEIDEREKARRMEYLSFAIREIDAAKLSPQEEEELKNESQILSNAEKIFTDINTASELLKGDRGILPGLKRAEQCLSAVSRYDSNVSDTLDGIRNSLYSLEDAAQFLRDYERSINYSPQRVNEVEERLSLIANLRKKYGATVAEVLDFAEKSRRELEAISTSEERVGALKAEYQKAVREAKTVALELSESRKKAAKALEGKVMAELGDLAMGGTSFRVSITRETSPDGEIEAGSDKYVLYPHGIDRVEFLIAANAGEDLKQLRRVASGGEMSRIMLALKNVLLSSDIVESLIFDEVDAGIGGKTADTVGRKLKALSKNRQVLVITHLPQIAAMSDIHFTVQKSSSGNRTVTSVKRLNRSEKVREVARMLSGEKVTDITLRHAEEMVATSER
ncbi:MAG TPA: DNA repair protein RecN [Spirochaetota bacterium]|nr:DNA repair protein RecN [Spirochaetota bacterium]